MDSSEHLYAVEDLAEFMRISKDDENPFIFITGAGCSVTAGIPLAKKIVSELNEQFRLELKPLSDEDRKDYGKCMGRLETSKRRKYLQNYISKAKINWAHIALACLMKEGYIRRVMTFNFDNLLARSCGLLGEYPPIYDFTAANLNLHRLIDDPAIVHLHGQGHGFVQLNTDVETELHAARLEEFVNHILSESPTLFIGYSGSSDAFLPQVEEQFCDQHRLFWVDMGEQAPEHLQRKLLTSSLAHYMSCKDGADLFLIKLAQELDCFPPTIFADPYQHLLDELEDVTNYPMLKNDSLDDAKESQLTQSDGTTQDILLETKNRLREVQQQDKEQGHDFVQEYLQGDYQKIIKVLEKRAPLNHDQSLWLARSYFSLALEEPNELEKIRIYEKLIDKFKESVEVDIQEQVCSAFVNKAIAFGEIKQPYNEIKAYDELIARFLNNDNLILKEHVAVALLNKTVALYELGQLDKTVKVCDEVITYFSDSEETILQKQVARALLNKAVTLGTLENLNKAIEVCDELILRFSDNDELIFQEQVAKAAFNKAVATEKLGQLYQAIEIYDALIARYSGKNEFVFQEQVAKALLNKGTIFAELELSDKSIEVYNELIAKLVESTDISLQELLSEAFNNIGYLRLLAAKKHWQKNPSIAKEYLDKASKCFSKALTKSSRNNHALILANLAYTEFVQGNTAESEVLLRKVLKQGGQSIYNKVLEEINKYTIDIDISFKELLEKLWNEINN